MKTLKTCFVVIEEHDEYDYGCTNYNVKAVFLNEKQADDYAKLLEDELKPFQKLKYSYSVEEHAFNPKK